MQYYTIIIIVPVEQAGTHLVFDTDHIQILKMLSHLHKPYIHGELQLGHVAMGTVYCDSMLQLKCALVLPWVYIMHIVHVRAWLRKIKTTGSQVSDKFIVKMVT